jgi:hypothetical protein
MINVKNILIVKVKKWALLDISNKKKNVALHMYFVVRIYLKFEKCPIAKHAVSDHQLLCIYAQSTDIRSSQK